MKNKELIIFETILLLFIIILKIVFIDFYTNQFEIINALFWVISTMILIKIIGYKKDNLSIKNTIIQTTLISLMIFILITYLSGIYFGFLKNSYDTTFSGIIKNTYSTFIMIICEEIIRYMFAKKENKSNNCLIILTILYIILDIIIIYNPNTITTKMESFVFLTTNVIPSISRNILCSYIAKNVSFVPCLIIRLYFGLNKYILPIFPDYGYFIESLLLVTYPYIVYLSLNRIIVDYKQDKYVKISKKLWYINIPIIFFLLILISLTLGIFKYKMIAIGSGSMEPIFYRGDTIIYEKIDKKYIKKPKVGEILVFKHDGEIISHRIIEININNKKYYYQTKGDNNATKDDFTIEEKDVLGVVKLRIKWIGLPTIWLNDLIK